MIKEQRKHLISLADLSDTELYYIVSRGLAFATGQTKLDLLLKGLIIGIYFRKTSTRTRTSFSVAALRMGAQIISYGPADLQENTGESTHDTTQVLSRMLDCFVARTAGSAREMRVFASQNRMAVINAMSEDEHPTQALADLTTIFKHFGQISGLRILYLGEGNNTASALAQSIPRYPKCELFFYTPPGYGIPEEALLYSQKISKKHGSTVFQYHNLNNLPTDLDIIYTTRWETTGTSKVDVKWRETFKPFKVSQELINKYPNAIFMHDLPAHRDVEVESSVIDGSSSIVFEQAENKLYSAAAVLEWCLKS